MTRAALLLMDLQASMVGRMGSPELLAAVQGAHERGAEEGVELVRVVVDRLGVAPCGERCHRGSGAAATDGG